MGSPYVGELRLVGFNFAPLNWMQCQGQMINIADNATLYQLLGTTYGGDGQATFAVPNLASRVPVHMGTGTTGTPYVIGNTGGAESVTLTMQQYPAHSHSVQANSNAQGNVVSPANNILSAGQNIYRSQPPGASMAADMLSTSGGNQPHTNLQPFLALNWIISLYGIFPSPS